MSPLPRLFVLLALAACGGDKDTTPLEPGPTEPGPTEPGPTEPGPTDPLAPTWHGDVAQILQDNCVTCHQDGGIGSFALDTYETATTWAEPIVDAVVDRRMPPWLVTDDGSCGDFRDSRWMSDADIQTLSDWVAADTPLGDPQDGPTGPLPELPQLDRVDHTLNTPTFTPEIVGGQVAQYDEYRCFALDNPAGADIFLTGFDVHPGNDAIVHHVLGMPVDPEAPGWNGVPNGAQIEAMDGADGRPGWPCFGAAGGDIREEGFPVIWAPGMGAVSYPDGVGVELSQDDVVVVQIHYNLVDPTTHGQSDSTGIALRTAPQVDREAFFALPDAFLESLFYGDPEVIPPGESAHEYSFSLSGFETLLYSGAPPLAGGFDLIGVMPHMHELGSKQRLTLRAGGDAAEECLADVARWDFNWQLFYFYEDPISVDRADQLEISCTWDSSGTAEPTLPGWGTYNEMCLMSMMIVPW